MDKGFSLRVTASKSSGVRHEAVRPRRRSTGGRRRRSSV